MCNLSFPSSGDDPPFHHAASPPILRLPRHVRHLHPGHALRPIQDHKARAAGVPALPDVPAHVSVLQRLSPSDLETKLSYPSSFYNVNVMCRRFGFFCSLVCTTVHCFITNMKMPKINLTTYQAYICSILFFSFFLLSARARSTSSRWSSSSSW